MQYSSTGKVTLKAFLNLVTHALDNNGLPMCGQKASPWKGYTGAIEQRGAGEVTCGRCLKVLNSQ
jgi:hypothetical protein